MSPCCTCQLRVFTVLTLGIQGGNKAKIIHRIFASACVKKFCWTRQEAYGYISTNEFRGNSKKLVRTAKKFVKEQEKKLKLFFLCPTDFSKCDSNQIIGSAMLLVRQLKIDSYVSPIFFLGPIAIGISEFYRKCPLLFVCITINKHILNIPVLSEYRNSIGSAHFCLFVLL